MKNKVSILMTSYNAGLFIKRSIKSILNQTYKNFEIILVDDYSSDETLKVVKNLESKKIKLVALKKHVGRTSALNYGLKKITGEFVAILDADDIAHKDRLKVQIDYFKNNKEINIVGSWYNIIDKHEQILVKFEKKYKSKEIYNIMLFRNIFCHSTIMFRKKILKKIGNYPKNITYAQDYAFLLKAMKFDTPSLIHKCLVSNRRWNNSMTYNQKYKIPIIIDKIKNLIFSYKNFKFSIKSLFFWYLIFLKTVVKLIILKITAKDNK